MDERTRAATYEDVLRVAELLEGEHVEYAVIGGYALAIQGIVRLTEDVDVLVEPTPENARRWVRALSQLPDGAAKELDVDVLSFHVSASVSDDDYADAHDDARFTLPVPSEIASARRPASPRVCNTPSPRSRPPSSR